MKPLFKLIFTTLLLPTLSLSAANLKSCLEDGVSPVEQLMKDKKWARLTADVANDIMFTTFDMKQINVSTNNVVDLNKNVTLLGQDIQFNGEISVNPLALNGEVLAKYSATMSDGNFYLASLNIQKLNVDICMVRENDKTKIYSAFTANVKRKKRMYKVSLHLDENEHGEVMLMRAGQLSLTEMLPMVNGVNYLDDFELHDVIVSEKEIEYKGEIKGQEFHLKSLNTAKDKLLFDGSVLSLKDILPISKKLPYLSSFKLDQLVQHGTDIRLSGSVNSTKFDIHSNVKDLKSFTIQSDGIPLSSAFPLGYQQKYLKGFSISSLSYSKEALSLKGNVNDKSMELVVDTSRDKHFYIKGDALLLANVLPNTKNISYLNTFILSGLDYSEDNLRINGSVSDKVLSINVDLTRKEYFDIDAKHLSFSAVLPSLKTQKYLNRFDLEKLIYNHGVFSLEGELKDDAISIVVDTKRHGDFSIKTDTIKLSSIVPSSSSLMFLSSFDISLLRYVENRLLVTGDYKGKELEVSLDDLSTDAFSIKSNALALGDMFGFIDDIDYLSSALIYSLHFKDKIVQLQGKLNRKPLALEIDLRKKSHFRLNRASLAIQDVIPASVQLKAVSKFMLETLEFNKGEVDARGKLEGIKVSLKAESEAEKGFSLIGNLNVEKFLPVTRKEDYLKQFKMRSLLVKENDLQITGLINAKSITIQSDMSHKDSFTIMTDKLALSDIIPSVNQLKFFDKFMMTKLSHKEHSLTVSGLLSGKKISLTKDLEKSQSFSMKAKGIKVSDLFSPIAKAKYLKKFSFETLKLLGNKLTLLGELDGDALNIDIDLKKPKNFSITTSSLKLVDIIPQTRNIEYLDDFTLDRLKVDDKQLSLTGSIDNKSFDILTDISATSGFTIHTNKLNVKDIFPFASKQGFLSGFALNTIAMSENSIALNGSINGKEASLSFDIDKADQFSVKADALAITDVFPEVKSIKALKDFRLNKLTRHGDTVTVEGSVNHKLITLRQEEDKAISISMEGFVVSDFFQSLKSMPTINTLAIKKATLNRENFTVEVMLNGSTINIMSSHASANDYVAILFKQLNAASLIPCDQNSILNEFSLKDILFLYALKDSTTVKSDELPEAFVKALALEDKLIINKGINLQANLDSRASKTLKRVLKTLSIDKEELFISGKISLDSFKALGKSSSERIELSTRVKSSILDDLSLNIKLPTPDIKSYSHLFDIKDGVYLTIEKAKSKQSENILVDISFDMELKGMGVEDTLFCSLELDKSKLAKSMLLSAKLDGIWNKPFKIPSLALSDSEFTFVLNGNKKRHTQDITLKAKADIGSQKDVQIHADIKHNDDGISLKYFELDGSFALTDFEGGSKIPHANEFVLENVKMSPFGVEMRVEIASKVVDAYLFDHAGWNFALDQTDFYLTEILPVLNNVKPIREMKVDKALLLLSEKGLHINGASPQIIKDQIKEITGSNVASVHLKKGVGIITTFSADTLGSVGKGLSKIGVDDNAIISGELTGLFGSGVAGFKLNLSTNETALNHGLPNKVLSYKKGPNIKAPEYFIQYNGLELDAGAKVVADIKAGKDRLTFDTVVRLDFNEKELKLRLLGEMEGTWSHPFGINGLNLNNVKFDTTVNDTGEVEISFSGEEQFGECKGTTLNRSSDRCLDMNMTTQMQISLDDALPDGVVFSGSAGKLTVPALLDITQSLMPPKEVLSEKSVPFFEIHDARLVFATPEMSDPQFGLMSDGFTFGGEFFFMGKKLGTVQGSGGRSGVSFKGAIADIKLDHILNFKNNNIDILLSSKPKFKIASNIDIFGSTQDILIDIEPPYLEFDLTEKMGIFGETDFRVTVDGFDLQTGKFSSESDIEFIGEFKSNLLPWMKDEIKKGVEELKASIDTKLSDDLNSLADAKRSAAKIDKKIREVKASVIKAEERANLRTIKVKQGIDTLKKSYENDIYKSKHCGTKWDHWACSAAYKVSAFTTNLVYEVTKEILNVSKVSAAAAYDLSPIITPLQLQRDAAYKALAKAKSRFKVAKSAEDFVLHSLDDLLQATHIHLPFEIEKARFHGDLRDMIEHDAPLVFDMKYQVFGFNTHDYFALNIPAKVENLKFDKLSFALLPIVTMDKMIKPALSKVDKKIEIWVNSYLATKLGKSETSIRNQLKGLESKYENVLSSFTNNSKKYQQSFTDIADEKVAIIKGLALSDMMAKSSKYRDTFLVSGHSSLCLSVADNGIDVYQTNCSDANTVRWSTKSLDDGYVQLKSKGLCLKAKNKNNKEGAALGVSACNENDIHEQWKVISRDGFYDQIVNRYSQKCLHFDSENANDKSAFATWTSCFGFDSQTFRAITESEKPTHYHLKKALKSNNSNCLRTNKNSTKFYSGSCDDSKSKSIKLLLNYTEEINGNIRLIDNESGNCLLPDHKDSKLSLKACDSGKDMFWRIEENEANAWELYSPYYKKCLHLPKTSSSSLKEVSIESCDVDNEQLFDFLK
jgi:hypothetical protein